MSHLDTYTLRCGRIEATVTNLGARVMRLLFDGIDTVLGYDTADDYRPERHLGDFGAVIGRYANRLAGGRITVDGQVYQLPQNNGPNCLHGGPDGWQYRLFDAIEVSEQRLVLALTSPDGDNGFPGTVHARVTYTLTEDSLRIDYHAESDRTTVLNLTNHSYFNLDGTNIPSAITLGNIHNHRLKIDADLYSPTDEVQIPLPQHASVEGTPFDFRQGKTIGADIDSDDPQLHIGRGYDHNFVLRHPGLEAPAAELCSPLSGIVMELYTTAPGLQIYTGNYLDGVHGKGGVAYPVRSAVCLETQQYPDSPNHHWPESTGYLLPGQPFDSTTIFKFRH